MKLILVLLCVITVAHSVPLFSAPDNEAVRRYDDYKVFKVRTKNESQKTILTDLLKQSQDFNVWADNHQEMDIMVSPKVVNYFSKQMDSAGIETELWVKNVQSLIDAEKTVTTDSDGFTWTSYHELEEIYSFLDDMLSNHPGVTEGFIVGDSYEGRTIRGIKISYKANNPGIYIEANIHAREWLTSATATYLINQLLTSTDAEVRELAEQHDWYIIPVLNVDGFAYTHSTDRLWRKNRRPNVNSTCYGVDINRNFNFHWMENGGASSDPCSESYAGVAPFSEPEAQVEAAYFSTIQSKINFMLALHTYGQYALYVYGHSQEERPENESDLRAVAKVFVDSVAELPSKTQYEYGATPDLLYLASGTASDWVYSQGVGLTYTIEMRDTGRYGFVVPPVQILPNAQEVLTGIIQMAKKAKELNYMQVKY